MSPNDFTDTNQISERLSAFETHESQIATPCHWGFTRTTLRKLLERIKLHESHEYPPGRMSNPRGTNEHDHQA